MLGLEAESEDKAVWETPVSVKTAVRLMGVLPVSLILFRSLFARLLSLDLCATVCHKTVWIDKFPTLT